MAFRKQNSHNLINQNGILFDDPLISAKTIRKKNKIKIQWKAFLWMLVPFAFLIIFSYYPPIKAFFDSFFDSFYNADTGTSYDKFVGIGNYVEIFNDPVFWTCVKNVIIFTLIGLICGNLMTIILAELLFNMHSKKLSAFYRVLFIIPILVPSIVVLLIWKYVVFGNNGFMNSLLIAFDKDPSLWYWSNVGFEAKFAIIFTNFPWVAGTSFLIYLAGLQNIPKSVMEASLLDNCSVWKRIRKIDLPLIVPQLKYFLVMGVIGGLQNFDLQLIVVGAETDATIVPGLYIYDRAFGLGFTEGLAKSRFGYASAVGMILLVVTMGLTILNMRLNTDKTKKDKKTLGKGKFNERKN